MNLICLTVYRSSRREGVENIHVFFHKITLLNQAIDRVFQITKIFDRNFGRKNIENRKYFLNKAKKYFEKIIFFQNIFWFERRKYFGNIFSLWRKNIFLRKYFLV